MTTKLQTEFKKHYGPWAVVTGASSGIGREFALELASLGLDLVLVARNEDSLDTLARDLADEYGTESLVVSLDLAEPSATERLVELTRQLDVGLLVASAGFGMAGLFVEQERERHSQMVDLNCRALMEQTHSFAKRMKTREQSGMILLSSIVGFQGMPYSANYAATKAYVQVLAESLKVELASDGIEVLAVAPGPVATKFGETAGMELG